MGKSKNNEQTQAKKPDLEGEALEQQHLDHLAAESADQNNIGQSSILSSELPPSDETIDDRKVEQTPGVDDWSVPMPAEDPEPVQGKPAEDPRQPGAVEAEGTLSRSQIAYGISPDYQRQQLLLTVLNSCRFEIKAEAEPSAVVARIMGITDELILKAEQRGWIQPVEKPATE